MSSYRYRRQSAKKREIEIPEHLRKMFDDVLKPYYDLYNELEKIYGKDKANEIVNAQFAYDFRGLFYGKMIM